MPTNSLRALRHEPRPAQPLVPVWRDWATLVMDTAGDELAESSFSLPVVCCSQEPWCCRPIGYRLDASAAAATDRNTERMMGEVRAQRPYMPGYGILGADQGRGLLSWSWAEQRLVASHDYWVATVSPDGRPHLMPVWGVWSDRCVWFSSSRSSRKARNLAQRPACTVATDNAFEPVVVQGTAERVTDREIVGRFAELIDVKYSTDYGPGFYDPAVNSIFRVLPIAVIGLTGEDFTGSPTRWTFPSSPQ